ncbi:MAG: hypothetical protein Q4E02_05595 [Lagierella massiliensis]|nr:hypothetical protein [Lagierella massiliensis]
MNIMEFSNYLLSKGNKKKVVSDIVSRLKRIDNELILMGTSIDEQYSVDKCNVLIKSFSRKTSDFEKMLKGSSLPLDKPEIANYKYSLNKYLGYLDLE